MWDRAKAIFTDPIDRIISFAKGLVNGIIEFIKDAILRPLAKLAEGTKGYDLLKAVLGKDPVTGDPVPQTADTLIGGFMKLIGQEEVWNNLKKANGVARAWAWFKGAMASLMGSVGQIPTLFLNAFKSLELVDIVLVPRAFAKVAAVFGKFIGDFMSWAGNAVWNLLEIIFDVVSPGAFGYIKKTGAALKSILKNPLPFIGNLVKAAKLGFQNFANNFGGHLKAGLIDWLTGSLPGVYIPKAFSLSEIVKFVFSVLGLTWQNIRQKLVKVVGETAVKAMETGFDLVVMLVTQGPAAAWDNIKEQLANLKDMVIGGISDFVVDMVKKRAIPKIVAMFIPGAGFISAILSIYDTVMVFVNKISKITQVVTGFINSISAIASGAIGAAASRVENTLAGLLSLAINFLAGFAGLGKVSDKVMGVINTKARTPVDKAIDWLINWIVTMAKKLFAKVFGKKNKPDERSQEQKKTDLAKGIAEAQKFLEDKKLSSDQVKKKLPAIKSKYKITIFELVTDTKSKTKKTNHIHGEIHSIPVVEDGGMVDRENSCVSSHSPTFETEEAMLAHAKSNNPEFNKLPEMSLVKWKDTGAQIQEGIPQTLAHKTARIEVKFEDKKDRENYGEVKAALELLFWYCDTTKAKMEYGWRRVENPNAKTHIQSAKGKKGAQNMALMDAVLQANYQNSQEEQFQNPRDEQSNNNSDPRATDKKREMEKRERRKGREDREETRKGRNRRN